MQLNTIYNENCFETLSKLEDNSIDSIVTDPPYELGFMGKKWDATGIAFNEELWKEMFRVLKPGGHVAAFSGTRTVHRMAVAIEDAGFEIRDQLQWVYNSGFPKSHDVSKAIDKKYGAEREVIGKSNSGASNKPHQTLFSDDNFKWEKEINITAPSTDEAKKWSGWGTSLKPSFEPIVLARKPLSEKTVAENVLKWGTGAINIDATRIGYEEGFDIEKAKKKYTGNNEGNDSVTNNFGIKEIKLTDEKGLEQGRFPANTITLEEHSEVIESKYFNILPKELQKKSSKKDRNQKWNYEEMELKNGHPTVKPIELMAWLIKLITPVDGTTYDPFSGSGSTLVAAKRLQHYQEGYENLKFIGSELSEEYCDIVKARLEN